MLEAISDTMMLADLNLNVFVKHRIIKMLSGVHNNFKTPGDNGEASHISKDTVFTTGGNNNF